jgi:hypothetical protein
MKTAEKRQPMPQREESPTRGEIQTAYEVHTLTQMIYGQLVMPHAGTNFSAPARGFEQPTPYTVQPWGQSGPAMWGYVP